MTDFLYKGFPPAAISVYRDPDMPAETAGNMLKNLRSGRYAGLVHEITVQSDPLTGSLSFTSENDSWQSDAALVASSPDHVGACVRDAVAHGADTVFVASPTMPARHLMGLAAKPENPLLILGPDWQGIAAPGLHLALHTSARKIKNGNVGVLCQSAHCFHQAASAGHILKIGFSCLCHAAGGDLPTLLGWLAQNPDTRVVGIQAAPEDCGRPLLSSVRLAASEKIVVVLLAPAPYDEGSPQDTAAAAAEALVRSGAVVTESSEDFFEILRTFQSPVRMTGSQIAVISDTEDAAREFRRLAGGYGLSFPRFKSPELEALTDLALIKKPLTNPVMIERTSSPIQLAGLIRATARLPSVHGIACLLSNPPQKLLDKVEGLQDRLPVPVICVPANQDPRALPSRTSRSSMESAACALGALAAKARIRETRLSEDALGCPPDQAAVASVRNLILRHNENGNYALDPLLMRRILQSARIACREKYAVPVADAVITAEKIGFPVDAELQAAGLASSLQAHRLSTARSLMRGLTGMELLLSHICPGAGERKILLEASRPDAPGQTVSVRVRPVAQLGLGMSVAAGTAQSQPVLLPISRNTADQLSRAVLGSAAASELLQKVSWLAASYPEIRSLSLRAGIEQDGTVVSEARGSACPPAMTAGPLLAFRPLPAFEKRALSKRGTLLIRSIRPEDRPKISALFSRLSPDSIYSRFHVSLSMLSEDQLSAFSAYDPEREVAVAALSEDNVLRGVARARTGGLPCSLPSAEFAVLVDDRWQRLGIASLLMKCLEQEMAKLGCRRLVGRILVTGTGMIELAKKLGFRKIPSDPDSDTVLYAKDL